MVPFLDRFKVHASVVGNHDLDHGIERFTELKEMNDIPWLLSNVFDTDESRKGL